MKPKTWTLPKFRYLASKLGGFDVACGVLEWIWNLAASFDPEHGMLPCTDWQQLLAFTSVEDRYEEVGQLLIQQRWVDEEGGDLFVHDWADHRPAYLNERIRKARYRGKMSRDRDGTGTGQSGTRDAPSASASASAEEQKKNKQKKRETAPSSFSIEDLPENLQMDSFIACWREWENHRKESKSKLTDTTRKRQLSKCARIGPLASIRMINRSIENGWKGLFEEGEDRPRKQPEPSSNGNGSGNHRPLSTYERNGAPPGRPPL